MMLNPASGMALALCLHTSCRSRSKKVSQAADPRAFLETYSVTNASDAARLLVACGCSVPYFLIMPMLTPSHNIYVNLNTYTRSLSLLTYIPTCVYVCIHTYMKAYIHACIHTCIHTCIHAYIKTHAQARRHVHMHTYHTIPYHTIPYHTIPYHTIPYHTIPYHTIPYHTIPYHTIPYHTIPYHTIPYHTIPYHTIPYHTIPYHTIPYYTYMWCCSIFCHIRHGDIDISLDAAKLLNWFLGLGHTRRRVDCV